MAQLFFRINDLLNGNEIIDYNDKGFDDENEDMIFLRFALKNLIYDNEQHKHLPVPVFSYITNYGVTIHSSSVIVYGKFRH